MSTVQHFPTLDRRRLFRYSVLYLLLTSVVLMIQSYIRYGGHSSYDPTISLIYLGVSVLGFIPIIPGVHKLIKWFHEDQSKEYVSFAVVTTAILITLFYGISNILLTLLGYFDFWIDAEYASWYFGKEALIHTILLGGNFYFLRQRPTEGIQKMISANQGRKEVTIKTDLIEWIEADDHYLKIHLANQSLIKRTTLEKMAEELQPEFVRIHRKYLVNKNEIVGKEKAGRDEYVVMKTGAKVKVGRSYQPLDVL